MNIIDQEFEKQQKLNPGFYVIAREAAHPLRSLPARCWRASVFKNIN